MSRKQKIILGVLITLLMLPWLLLGAVHLFAGDIKKVVIDRLNQQLWVKVQVAEIDLEIFSSFPDITLHLSQVVIPSEKGFATKQFLNAQDIFLHFNLWDVLNKDYKIRSILASDILLFPEINVAGEGNYDIFKPSKNKTPDQPLIFELSGIRFRRLNFGFRHQGEQQTLRFQSQDLWLKGKFADIVSEWSLYGETHWQEYRSGQLSFLKDKKVLLDIQAKVNTKSGLISLSKGKIEAAKLKLSCTGSITNLPKGIDYQLQITGNDLTIPSMLSILPGDWTQQLSQYESRGDLQFNAQIKGLWSNAHIPLIKADFGIRKGSLIAPHIKTGISDIDIAGLFTNGGDRSMQNAFLSISPFSARIGNNKIQGLFKITELHQPKIEAALQGQIDLGELSNFLSLKGMSLEGKLESNVKMQGHLSDFKEDEGIGKLKISGEVIGSDLTIKRKELSYPIKVQRIRALANKDQIDMNDIKITYGPSDFDANITCRNFTSWLQSIGNLSLLIDFTSEKCLADGFIPLGNDTTSGSQNSWLDMKLNGYLKEITFRETVMKQVRFKADIQKDKYRVHECKAQVFGGEVRVDEAVIFSTKKGFQVSFGGEGKKIDISRMFKECRNFGQTYLTDQNLKGKADFNDLQLSLELDSKMKVITSSMVAAAGIVITQGALNNFDPAMALSKFARVDDLKNLKFDRLENQISIVGEKVMIPEMEVRSNALNLSISGTHTFENYMDYYIRLKLTDLVFNRWKSKNPPEEGELIDGGKKGVNLYFHLTGIPPDIKFSYDRKGGQIGMKEKMEAEKKEVQQSFRQTLGPLNDPKLNPSRKDTATEEPLIFDNE